MRNFRMHLLLLVPEHHPLSTHHTHTSQFPRTNVGLDPVLLFYMLRGPPNVQPAHAGRGGGGAARVE